VKECCYPPHLVSNPTLWVTHLLFVDDVLIFCSGARRDAEKLATILDLFGKATGMEINRRKSTLSIHKMEREEVELYLGLFPFEKKGLDEGLKYLGFHLNPNNYRKGDWLWLLEKLEKRLKGWSFRWLSWAGRVVLEKSVLEAIPVYWMSLAWIPKGILERARRICFKFIWAGSKDSHVVPWVSWEVLVAPKLLGGWGLKNIFLFSKALAAKSNWRLIVMQNLWTSVVYQKYIAPEPLEDWVRRPVKSALNCTIIWKALLNSFPIVGEGLAWRVGKGNKVRIRADPWPGSGNSHRLQEHMVHQLNENGFFFLSQIVDPERSSIWAQEWKGYGKVGLEDHFSEEWGRYIRALQSAHIHISDKEDELVWKNSPFGMYTPKLGYTNSSLTSTIRSLSGGGRGYGKSNVLSKHKSSCGV
jgi:hypothetical protein